AVAASNAPVVAVSPFVGGRAVKGPTEAFCEQAGIDTSATGIVRSYDALLDGVVADEHAEEVPALVTDTIMDAPESRARLAGDTPLVDAGEVDDLLERAPERGVAIVPDRHGAGTNALVLSPPDAIAPSFGPDSCERHLAAAGASGLPHAVERVPSLALDVDTP